MRLGVLGGTFDPIHWGHLLVAEMTRDILKLERILFVPAGDPPHKQAIKKTPPQQRQRMVELAIADNPNFELCKVDMARPGPHYSVDTIGLIRKQYKLSAEACFFIIGGDSLADLPGWHKPQTLITLCRLAIVYRPGYQPDIEALEGIIPGLSSRLNGIPLAITVKLASSMVRNSVKAGQSIRYLVPDKVRIYIKQYQLYV